MHTRVRVIAPVYIINGAAKTSGFERAERSYLFKEVNSNLNVSKLDTVST